MGHYDNCRDGYCAGCGAAPGNLNKDGTCPFCDVPEAKKFKAKTAKPKIKVDVVEKEVRRLQAESAVFRALMKACPTTLDNAQAFAAWDRFTSSVHQAIALDKLRKDPTLPWNGTREHPLVLTQSNERFHPITSDAKGSVSDPLRWIDIWASHICRVRLTHDEPYSVNLSGDTQDNEVDLLIYRDLTEEEKKEKSAKVDRVRAVKVGYHLKQLRVLVGEDGIANLLKTSTPTMAEVANTPTKMAAEVVKKPKPRTKSILRSKA